MPFKLKGLTSMLNDLSRVKSKFNDGVLLAMADETKAIAKDSKNNYVPVAEGDLRDTIHATKPVREGRMIKASVVAGGPGVPHAVAVHENPSEHDPPTWVGKTINFSPSGRGPKFISKPLTAAIPGMDDRIARKIKV